MGINNLWTILGPYCEKKPLFELQGKTVAVDLSCWICEAQNIAEYQVQPRMYLRNLYFRTCYLLLMDVNPVFVLEGKAPTLKYDTIAARNQIQFKGAAPKKDGVKTGKDRTRFHFTLRQCEEMLKFMGLACVTGKGEAEAMCAYLNEDNLVDGCISQDSDCFAYGAKIVYRNFSISTQGATASSGGSVDVYDIRKATNSMGIGRNKIIALALLAGCDYTEGVMGVGKESVLKLFETVKEEKILDKLRAWKNNTSLYNEYYQKLNNKNICTSCGHSGKITAHTKSGCASCKTTKGCNFSLFKNQRQEIKNELNMRTKALANPDFPNEELIKEFLERKDNISSLNLKWKQPDLISFVNFSVKYLTWEEIYAFEKFLPVLTRWQLTHFDECSKTNFKSKGLLYPDYIKKVRNPKGTPSYEIIWKDKDNCFTKLIPEEQLSTTDTAKLYSTIEPQHLVEKAYPELVEVFKQSKIKPKKPSKRKKATAVDEISDKLANSSITEPKPKRKPRIKTANVDGATKKATRKKKQDVEDLENSFGELDINKENDGKQKKIDSYFRTALLNSAKEKNALLQPACSSLNCSFDLDASEFDEEVDEHDLSDIINKIVKNNPVSHYLKDEFNLSVTGVDNKNDEEKHNINNSSLSTCRNERVNMSVTDDHNSEDVQNFSSNEFSFFITNPVEQDFFEKTFEKVSSDSSDSEDCNLDDENHDDFNASIAQSEEEIVDVQDNDEFSFLINNPMKKGLIRKPLETVSSDGSDTDNDKLDDERLDAILKKYAS